MTKLHPILFSTMMVQALLAGTKTQTRRLVKPQPIDDTENSGCVFSGDHKHQFRNDVLHVDWKTLFVERCCRYEVGDILWVRETWQAWALGYIFRADYGADLPKGASWKPSLFMPREACRLFLKLKSIRIEPLQAISESDAVAEGYSYENFLENFESVVGYPVGQWLAMREDFTKEEDNRIEGEPVAWYAWLWEKINGKGSWESNPFVWVYEFERVEKP